jgi:hypothetical protein
MMAVAVKWPPELAIGIARSLDPGASVTRTDIRIGQLTLEGVLADQPDVVGDPEGSGERFAAALVAQRSRRLEQVHRERTERLRRAEEGQKAQINALTASRSSEHEARLAAEREVESLRSAVDQSAASLEKAQTLGTRRTIRAVMLTLGVVLAALFGVYQLWFLLGGAVITIGVFWERSIDWLESLESDWRRLLLAPVAEAAGLVLQVFAS